MKIHVVKDKSGKTIGSYEASSTSGTSIKPVLADGAKEAEMEVAANYKENLNELYK